MATPTRTQRTVLIVVAAFLFGGSVFLNCVAAGPDEHVRQSAVAGSFYPQDPKELAALVDSLISAAAPVTVKGQILAVVAPHAGYPYSGPVAGYTYAALKGAKFHRVVVIAPSHFEAFDFSSVYDGDAYQTPLGTVKVDKAFARKLAGSDPSIKLSGRGHVPSQEQGEHALEVELPFLQRTLGDFELVPVIMGDQSYEASRDLGIALAHLVQGTDTLIVASSDLSHYHPYDEAVSIDSKTLNAIREWDYLTLSDNFQRRIWEACGGAPVVAAMIAAERLGANQADILRYANSGDITGDRKRVVGYSAVAFTRSPGASGGAAPQFSLSPEEKQQLLTIARKSVESAVRDRKKYELPTDLPKALLQDRGAFVTITRKGDLRGCIGFTAPVESLAMTVRDVATHAALNDPRFGPVTASELPDLRYEVSVLSPLRHVADVSQIKVGENGLLIKEGEREGLLLPQVPREQGWQRKTFLEQTAVKAGLPPDAWRDKDADLFMFTAIVFHEAERP